MPAIGQDDYLHRFYSEDVDFDPDRCPLYIKYRVPPNLPIRRGLQMSEPPVLFLTPQYLVMYDPYKVEAVSKIEFLVVTRTKPFQAGGVALNPYSRLWSAFETLGHEISGDDNIFRYDPAKEEVQDIEHDSRGCIYLLGEVSHTSEGLTGFAATGDILLASDVKNTTRDDEIYQSNMTIEEGMYPVIVSRNRDNPTRLLDTVHLWPKYGGKVLLVSEHERGVSVLRSADDKWEAAEYLLLKPNDHSLDDGTFNTATTEISQSVFGVIEWFTDPIVASRSAGNGTEFPLVNITSQIERLLATPQ
ncbi:hypothetical protein K449DRAFT_424858 [Hypoxylon sp. EC38]|nr:hypothetical protein K449DRAFT_424858 [Hypoxylon sp. EC38]